MLADMANGWSIDERRNFLDVIHQHAVIESLVAIVQLLKIHVLSHIVVAESTHLSEVMMEASRRASSAGAAPAAADDLSPKGSSVGHSESDSRSATKRGTPVSEPEPTIRVMR